MPLITEVSKGTKIRNRYNQVPHLTQDTNGKVTISCHKGCFFSIFALILTKALPRRLFYSICALTITKALPQRVFFSIFALYLTKALPKMMFFSIFALILSTLPPRFFFVFFCTNSNNSRCLTLFLPLF